VVDKVIAAQVRGEACTAQLAGGCILCRGRESEGGGAEGDGGQLPGLFCLSRFAKRRSQRKRAKAYMEQGSSSQAGGAVGAMPLAVGTLPERPPPPTASFVPPSVPVYSSVQAVVSAGWTRQSPYYDGCAPPCHPYSVAQGHPRPHVYAPQGAVISQGGAYYMREPRWQG